MQTRFARLRMQRYAAFLEDLISKNDPDYIFTVGNRGPHVVHAIVDDHPRLAAYSHRVHHLNAARFMAGTLAGKSVLILDDTTYHGTSLTLAKHHLERLSAQVFLAAFSMCDHPNLRRLRAENRVPYIEVLERLPEAEYAELVSDISEFIRAKGPVTPADITRFRIYVGSSELQRTLPSLLGFLSRYGHLSEHRYAERFGHILSFSLHWPRFFDPGFVGGVAGIRFDGIIKLRLRVDIQRGNVDVIPMVHPSASADALQVIFGSDHDLEFDRLRRLFRSHFAATSSYDTLQAAYDLLGFYLELRLARQLFDRLPESEFGWQTVDLPQEDLNRFYGPELGPQLPSALASFVPERSEQRPLIFDPPEALGAAAEPAPTVAFPALVSTVLRSLRKTYRRWSRAAADEVTSPEPTGYSFKQLVDHLKQSRLWTSEILDYLCDATLLSPVNQFSETKTGIVSIIRAYRAGEDRPPDFEAICAWVLWHFNPTATEHSPVPAIVAEKTLVALSDVFHLFDIEPRIDTFRSLHGKRPAFMEQTTFIRPRLFTLDTLPSNLYRKVDGKNEGYIITDHFNEVRSNDAYPIDVELRCRIEDAIDRLKKLYDLPRKAENLLLLTMLSSKAFGLDDAAADIELSVRHANEALLEHTSSSTPDLFRMRRSLQRANEASGVAGTKIRILERATEAVQNARRVLNKNSTAEKLILDALIHLPPNDSLVDQLRELRSLWRQTLAVARAATANKPPRPADDLIETIADVDLGLSSLMCRDYFRPAQPREQLLTLSHVGMLINTWCAAIGNAFHVTAKRVDPDSQHACVLVVDVTGFVQASLRQSPEVFRTATMMVMNVLEGWLRVFGASEYVYSRQGDKLIVGFTHPRAALLAACAMMHHVRRLRSAGMITFGEKDGCLKIGIDSGVVDTLPNADVISRAMNVGSRLCEHSRDVKNNILISAAACEYLTERSQSWIEADAISYTIASGGVGVGVVRAHAVRMSKVLAAATEDLVAIRVRSEKIFMPTPATP